jgi:alpha-D-ribose 1-methylphosphonate 5-triphosphate synthase subunit PhnG
MPLLSTGSGLLRYRLKDLVRVDGLPGGIPALTFLGRAGTTDLVGEKLTAAALDAAMAEITLPVKTLPVCTVAVEDAGEGIPGYLLLLEGESLESAKVANALDAALQQHFHYQLARNLEQLAPLRCVIHPDMRERYLQQCRERGMIEGNIKMESLQYWPGELPTWLRHPQVSARLAREVVL